MSVLSPLALRVYLSGVYEVAQDMDLTEDEIEEAAYKSAQEALEFWRNEASRRLDSTRDRYVDAIYIYEDFGEGVVIGLSETDEMVIHLEQGYGRFDMKPGLLQGRDSRVIPIRERSYMPVHFRTVTKRQGADKWIHPGWEGLHLVEEVDRELDNKIVPKYIEELVSNKI